MAFNSEYYLKAFRSDVDDPERPGDCDDSDSLWSNADIYRYMDNAQRKIARKTFCLRDIYELRLAVDRNQYQLPEWFLRPRRAKVVSDDRKVWLVNGEDNSSYETDYDVPIKSVDELSKGPVSHLIFDERSGYVRAAPIPTIIETVRIYIYRLPKKAATDEGLDLEIVDERFEEAMLLWMKKRAYEKQDTDTQNKGLARKYEDQFNLVIDDLCGEEKRRNRRVGTVSFGGGCW